MKNIKALFLSTITTLFFLMASAQYTSVDTSKIGDNDRVGHYIKTRGFMMYYETYGLGQPLLMIHGNGGSISNFMYQVPYFSKSYKVIVADSRAQGKSIDPGDSLSYEMMADDLNALLDSMHLDSCYVIGWSDGAVNALLLAIHHPGKVKKLAITGARLWSDTTAVDPTAYAWAVKYSESFETLKQTPEIKSKRKVVHLLTFGPNIPLEQLKKIQCPSMIIAGDHDVILPKHTLLIAATIPRSYLWIIPASGNSTPIYHKDLFNEVVSDFFKSPFKKIEGLDRFN
jgi:pimeloyl-ACP methyl ester carboxylesterase